MGQEFVIKSTKLEDKINQLLPSQGGQQAGVDLSASTTIIPIIDLTESAEGSNFREDLQRALSHKTANTFAVTNTTTTVITTTGYYRLTAGIRLNGAAYAIVQVSDGTTTKILVQFEGYTGVTQVFPIDLMIFNPAGGSIVLRSTGTGSSLLGSIRQIADINGNLINP
jgi:hypothetical protein